ncbi:hypothetical protein PN437_20160 [Microcystis aeruginosa CS-564/01]|uniref:hypothetical protein n=1 Tax=Microcystis aeruginosa TaxID=1126 RepID=UPI00232B882F|nr:hypothetical protein [Microcystis aeruginosa]MDB9427180.1 hypothetical protein [Microcystis aeruginosa CS-564/01]
MAISFSLNARQLATLQNFAETGESLNLAAKRLLLSILDERLDDRIQAIEIGIEADHYPDQEEYRGQTIAELQERIDKIEADKLSQDHRFGMYIESLEERIEKLETEVEILTTTPKQPATPNNDESVIFLADSEGKPIQFWSGQVWVDDLDLAYRYKAQQALARAIDKLKKRKLPGEPFPGRTIAFAPIEKLR